MALLLMALTIKDIMDRSPDKVKRFTGRCLSMSEVFSVLELTNGSVFVETQVVDETGIETTELLYSKDKQYFKIVSRSRSGGDHHPMRSYLRDSMYPIFSTVVL